jgi:hypothetical protein
MYRNTPDGFSRIIGRREARLSTTVSRGAPVMKSDKGLGLQGLRYEI